MRARSTTRGPEWSTTVLVDGYRVGVTVAGEGPPLLLLHGIGRDRRDWSEVLPRLAEHRQVVAVDLEGSGDSEPWADRVTLASMTAVVRRTLVAIGVVEPAVVIASSMGGAVALRLHEDAPEAVAALVLVSSAGFAAGAALGLRLMAVRGFGPALLWFRPIAARVQVRTLFADKAFATKRLVAEGVARLRPRLTRRTYFQIVHDLGRFRGVRPEWRARSLHALAMARTPTLVLWGERDAVLPVRQLAAARAALPHARARVLPGVGHMAQIEDPDGFLREVHAFLRDEVVPHAAAAEVPPATER
ncbi:alpha/beta hydrolase [Amnibacterium soli]|uniref:Alpha/beta hydrolase n=1 Tax=Amnibacterium soli TaxID=1282736 RepID=A0ABP8Z268_9MICO